MMLTNEELLNTHLTCIRDALLGVLDNALVHSEWTINTSLDPGMVVDLTELVLTNLHDRTNSLLAEVERLKAREQQSAAIITELTTFDGCPWGYADHHPDWEQRGCTYCYSAWGYEEPEKHDDDCPVRKGREWLGVTDAAEQA